MLIAVVPARGGSKRIRRKNLVDFDGRPIMEIPLATVLGCGLFQEVIVSTDDEEIADLAIRMGASVPFVRPSHLANDHASTAEVVIHAVNDFVERTAMSPDIVLVVYPTAVFLTGSDVTRMLGLLSDPEIEHVMTVGRYSSPIQRAFTSSDNRRLNRINPDQSLVRSQDLVPTFFDAGQAYASKPSAWTRILNGDEVSTGMVELEPWRVWDIDNPEDLEMATILYQYGKSRPPSGDD